MTELPPAAQAVYVAPTAMQIPTDEALGLKIKSIIARLAVVAAAIFVAGQLTANAARWARARIMQLPASGQLEPFERETLPSVTAAERAFAAARAAAAAAADKAASIAFITTPETDDPAHPPASDPNSNDRPGADRSRQSEAESSASGVGFA